MQSFDESSSIIDEKTSTFKLTAKRYLYFFLVNLIQLGIEFAYIIPIGRLFFLEYNDTRNTIQQNQTFSTAVKMTIGPIVGFIVQIIIGALSDSTTFSYGRRRPYMLIGLVIWFVGSFIIVCSSIYPIIFFESRGSDQGFEGLNFGYLKIPGLMASDIFYIFGTFFWTIGINMIQISYRSYLLDEFDDIYQNQVNLLSSFMSGLAQILYFGISSVATVLVKKPTDGLTNADIMQDLDFLTPRLLAGFIFYCVSIVILPLCVWLFCSITKETPYMSSGEKISTKIKNMANSCASMNVYMYLLLLVVFFAWLGWTPVNERLGLLCTQYLFAKVDTAYFANNVARFVYGCMLCISSLLLFLFNRKPEITMSLSNLFAGIIATMYYLNSDHRIVISSESLVDASASLVESSEALSWAVAIIPIACCAFAYAHLNATPYSLIRSIVPGDKFGFFLGILNASITFSQFFSNVMYVSFIKVEVHPGNLPHKYLYAVTPCFLISACVSTLLIFVQKKAPKFNVRADYTSFDDENQLN